MWATLSTNIEQLDPFLLTPSPGPRVTGIIADTRDESHTFAQENVPAPPANTFMVFCDGSSQAAGTGAAAVAPDGSCLKLRLGDQEHYTAYDGELTSVLLALGMARAAPLNTRFIWILNDSQTVIKDVTEPPPLKSGQHLRQLISKEINRLLRHNPLTNIALIWCAKGSDIKDHKTADSLAKAATQLPTASQLPFSYKAIQRQIRERERNRPEASAADPAELRRLLNTFNPAETYKALTKLTRPNTSFVAQLRAGHCPLNSYLFRFKAVDSPLCTVCGQKETVEHYLLLCRKFVGLRRRLFKAATKLNIPRTRQALLTNPKIFQALADFGRGSFRFYKSRYPTNGPPPPIPTPPPRNTTPTTTPPTPHSPPSP